MKSGLQYGDAFTDGVLTTTCTTCGAVRTLTATVEPCACGGRGTATKWTPVKLAMILLVASALRVGLAFTGGQLFDGDEGTLWAPGADVVRAVLVGNAGPWPVVSAQFWQQAHSGYRPISVVIALAAVLLGGPTALDESHLWLAAALNALAVPALALVLVAVVRRLGGRDHLAVLAAVFLTGSVAMVQWARHLVPYDWGLLLDWCALLVGLTAGGFWRGVTIGVLAMVGLLTYLGYGVTAVVAVLVGCVTASRARRPRMAIGILAGLALAGWLPSLLPWTVDFWWQQTWFMVHARAATGGLGSPISSPTEGPFVPFLYGWATEGWMLPVVGMLALLGWRTPVGRWALGGAVLVYAMLVLPSVHGLAVVFGRASRQLWPWMAMAAAAGTATLPRTMQRAMVALLVLSFGWQAWPLYQQQYPRTLREQWRAHYGTLAYATTVDGPGGSPGDVASPVVAVNVEPGTLWWPILGRRALPPVTTLLDTAPHPLAWPGWWYESYRPQDRAVLRGLRMELWRQ